MTGKGLAAITPSARRDRARAYRQPSGGRRTLAVAIQSIVATGTVYPSSAGTQIVSTSVTQNTTTVPSSIALSFSNVPVGNNEWAVVDVAGYDGPNGTGSHVDLGELAGLFNAGSGAVSASIDAGSTLRFQVGLSAMLQGLISSYDLQSETGLDGHLGTILNNAAPDPSTGLFTPSQLAPFMSTLYQSYNRTISLNGASGPALATVVYNYADTSEKNYVFNATRADAANPGYAQYGVAPSSGTVALAVVGNPFSSIIQGPVHTPTSTPPPAVVQVRAEGISAAGGSVQIQHVYGGKLYVGLKPISASATDAGSFSGAVQAVDARAPGDSSTVTLTPQSTTISMVMNDPQAAAFVGAPYYSLTPTLPYAFFLDCNYARSQDCVYGQNAVISVTSPNVSMNFDTFNPFGLSATQMQVCTGLDCFPLVAGATNSVRFPFYDGGNSLSFYGWTPVSGSAVSGIVQPLGGGYDVAYAGGASGSLQSTASAYFYPHQDVHIVSDASDGTTWTLTATCGGQVVQNSAQEQGGAADVFMMNVLPNSVQCSPIQLGFALPSGAGTSGTIHISSLGIAPPGRY